MPRADIRVTTLAHGGGTIATYGTADTSNDMQIPATANTSRLLLHIKTNGTAGTATLLAGDNPPSPRAGLGNQAISLAVGMQRFVVVESARFMQNDGTIHLDIENLQAAEVAAYQLPDGI